MHRNIKPSCVMLNHERTAFLGDFGFSVRGDTKLEQVRGSLRYMDPRMFVKDAVPDKAGDVYSYVMLLYELFTEQQPLPIFDDRTSRQQFVHAMRRHKKELLGDMLEKMRVRGLGSSKYAPVVAMIKSVIARGCALDGAEPLTSEMLPAVITDCAFKLFALPPHLLARYKEITGNVCPAAQHLLPNHSACRGSRAEHRSFLPRLGCETLWRQQTGPWGRRKARRASPSTRSF